MVAASAAGTGGARRGSSRRGSRSTQTSTITSHRGCGQTDRGLPNSIDNAHCGYIGCTVMCTQETLNDPQSSNNSR